MDRDIVVEPTDPDHPDAQALIGELTRLLNALTGRSGTALFTSADVRVPRSLFVVARDGAGAALGCGALRPLDGDGAAPIGEVKRMYARGTGRGVGSAVLARLEDAARTFGYRALWLETGIAMTDARRFYERHGYVAIPNYGPYATLDDSACYEKTLSLGVS